MALVKTFVNRTVSALPSKRLPTHYCGHWLWLCRESWLSVRSQYEAHMGAALKANLRRGDVFWDLGANVGFISLFAAQMVGKRGRVIAFEPSPDVFRVLQKNIGGVHRISALPWGIANENGVANFAACGVSPEGAFVKEVVEFGYEGTAQAVEDVPVQIRSIDYLIDHGFDKPNLIKIDIEGYELEALKGARGILKSAGPILLVEIHPYRLSHSGGSEEELFSVLRDCRYRWDTIDQNPNSLYTILAKPE